MRPLAHLEHIQSYDHDRCPGACKTSQGYFPMRSLDVKTSITGLLFDSHLTQTFENIFDVTLEATYIFPLPTRAAVRDCYFEVAGRVIKAELQERGAARRAYDEAIAAGKQAAIAEQERGDVFTMRVGNILPGQIVKVHLVLSGPLALEGDEALFRFPLVTSPRYTPGTPIGSQQVGMGTAQDTDVVRDASRISPPVLMPGISSPVALSFELEIDPAGLSFSKMRSSLHTIVTAEDNEKTQVRLQVGERLNRDFVLRFTLAKESLQSSLLTLKDEGSDEGIFALTLVPPSGAGENKVARDVVFVLDSSGSMQGWKMVAARRAVARMIDMLNANDRFSLVHFSSNYSEFKAGLLVANDRARFDALAFATRISAGGGTEMRAPLLHAASILSQATQSGDRGEREKTIVLITDGQVSNESQIIKDLGKHKKNVRVCTVGIDRAVNEGFLSRLAKESGGACELIESEEQLDEAMKNLAHKIAPALIRQVSIESRAIFDVTPSPIADLRAGLPLRIFGRFRGTLSSIKVVGKSIADSSKYEVNVSTQTSVHAALGSVWARARLQDLEDRFDKGERELRDEIIRVSLKHSALCRFTAFVAINDDEVVSDGGPEHHMIQAVEAVEGFGGAVPMARSMPVTMSAPMPMSAPMAMSAPRGRRGAPKRLKKMKSEVAPARLEESACFDEALAAPEAPSSYGRSDDESLSARAPRDEQALNQNNARAKIATSQARSPKSILERGAEFFGFGKHMQKPENKPSSSWIAELIVSLRSARNAIERDDALRKTLKVLQEQKPTQGSVEQSALERIITKVKGALLSGEGLAHMAEDIAKELEDFSKANGPSRKSEAFWS